ncbi:hypothetical protein HELRODRAFT_170967 [Helobdella robusta]|uniref:Uncharacterized protein n=1 Tax=Helobdella robusta TaxID=6412 RepID=T1F3M9_HELRO|nr:hypothetical protein HELRODRAFT_170967 [Helobdella robusta]ESO06932.1 hypothetical protein HELRODRAFT_170967 [Helobdella robusta]
MNSNVNHNNNNNNNNNNNVTLNNDDVMNITNVNNINNSNYIVKYGKTTCIDSDIEDDDDDQQLQQLQIVQKQQLHLQQQQHNQLPSHSRYMPQQILQVQKLDTKHSQPSKKSSSTTTTTNIENGPGIEPGPVGIDLKLHNDTNNIYNPSDVIYGHVEINVNSQIFVKSESFFLRLF